MGSTSTWSQSLRASHRPMPTEREIETVGGREAAERVAVGRAPVADDADDAVAVGPDPRRHRPHAVPEGVGRDLAGGQVEVLLLVAVGAPAWRATAPSWCRRPARVRASSTEKTGSPSSTGARGAAAGRGCRRPGPGSRGSRSRWCRRPGADGWRPRCPPRPRAAGAGRTGRSPTRAPRPAAGCRPTRTAGPRASRRGRCRSRPRRRRAAAPIRRLRPRWPAPGTGGTSSARRARGNPAGSSAGRTRRRGPARPVRAPEQRDGLRRAGEGDQIARRAGRRRGRAVRRRAARPACSRPLPRGRGVSDRRVTGCPGRAAGRRSSNSPLLLRPPAPRRVLVRDRWAPARVNGHSGTCATRIRHRGSAACQVRDGSPSRPAHDAEPSQVCGAPW